jgi:hypothetical protein
MPLETLVLMIFSVTSFLFMGRTFYQRDLVGNKEINKQIFKYANKQCTFLDTQYLGQSLARVGPAWFGPGPLKLSTGYSQRWRGLDGRQRPAHERARKFFGHVFNNETLIWG